MKAILAFLVVGLAAVFAAPSYNEIIEQGWTLIPDENFNMKMVSLEDVAFRAKAAQRSKVVVKFTLYTRGNPINGDVMVPNDAAWLAQSKFNPSNPTRIISHGWMGDGESRVITLCRDAYLARGEYNIIGIDWSQGGGTLNYIDARSNVNEAANQISTYVKFLIQFGLDLNNVYLIGHSLGAHVVGMTGKYLGGQVNSIFGLDPAMPLFFEDQPNDRLAIGDAKYIQTIQTNTGVLGFDLPLGDASFYPNWGGYQAGCGLDFAGTCSHYRSWAYMAESINDNQFYAAKCKGYESILEKYCPYAGASGFMGGEPANPSIKGIFYLPTNTKEPYAKGKYF